MSWARLDKQMATWSDRLVSKVKITPENSQKLATTVASDVRFLPPSAKIQIGAASPVQLNQRLEELEAFQGWMDIAHRSKPSPFITRAQVITQNYICFVYLPESCFRILSKVAPAGSTARKCALFLSNNPIRAFRNAIAHANWTYRRDYKGLLYWARRDGDPSEAVSQFEVTQEELTFWQSLSRCVAYAAFSNL
jgi:hypothetical protein